MWPFTSRRIMGSRWWALAFVVFVCWQAVEISGSSISGNSVDNTTGTEDAGPTVDDQQLHDAENGLKAM